jgi:hypothetical protein
MVSCYGLRWEYANWDQRPPDKRRTAAG